MNKSRTMKKIREMTMNDRRDVKIRERTDSRGNEGEQEFRVRKRNVTQRSQQKLSKPLKGLSLDRQKPRLTDCGRLDGRRRVGAETCRQSRLY